MAFFTQDSERKPSGRSKKSGSPYSADFLHKAECSACPLNDILYLKNPHMAPTGSDSPVVYMLGEAPGREEDRRGEQFVGKSGQLLRKHIPRRWRKGDKLRWNNCIRTRPPENRTPSFVEIECCRPSVVRDIESTKPAAIFGFGNIPLTWATGLSGISFWSGRRFPVRIGSHTCWFYAFLHPSAVLRAAEKRGYRTDGYDSELEFSFAFQLERAFSEVSSLPVPKVLSADEVMTDLTLFDGTGGMSDVRKISKILGRMANSQLVGLDYETNGTRPYKEGAKVLTAAVCDSKEALSFVLDHKQGQWSKKERRYLIDVWKEFIFGSDCLKAVHSLAFELEWSMVMFGDEALYNGNWGCSMAQAHTLDERYGSGALSLDGLGIQYFGISVKSLNPVNRADLDNVDLPQVLKYNAVDSRFHRMLFKEQHRKLKRMRQLDTYYTAVERVAGLVPIQIQGVPVSDKRARELSAKFGGLRDAAEVKLLKTKESKQFRKKFGKDIQPGSNADVKKLMNDILGFKLTSVDEKHLGTVESKVTKLILEYRRNAKVVSTYTSTGQHDSEFVFDGFFHPIFGAFTTRTWRTSSEDPNIQNWPKRENREVRSIVTAPRGYKIVAFDYAGIQARNVAMESRDPNLVKYFKQRYDIHSDWMERIVRHYPKWVKGGVKQLKDPDQKKKYRHLSKNKLVFPLFFGSGATSVSSDLKIPLEVARDLSDEFWDEFKGIRKWHDWARDFYRKEGYITGLSGFRRHAPVEAPEVINTPIQSDEAIIVCDAIFRLAMLGDRRFWPILEVHDDLTFLWQEEEIEKNAETVISVMLDTSYEWAKVVPLGVEMSIGDDWSDLEGVGEYYSDEWNGKVFR